MGSVLSWTANCVLFVLGCFLAADTANDVISATLLAPSREVAAPAARAEAAPARTWSDRQVILARNLFNSSTLAPPTPDLDVEDLEKSRLPVTLLGTFAASDPAQSRATLKDREKNQTLVVAVGDSIRGQATVTRIERRRVVLSENGASRELTLDDDEAVAARVRPGQAPPRAARAAPPQAVRRIGENRFALARQDVNEAIQNPADLLSQARVQPKFEDGQMVGLQVSGIKPGSVFEGIGMQEGDVITEFNGISIDSPEERVQIFQELANASEFNVIVRSPDGSEKTLSGAVGE